jgi:hypothetical protein
MVCGPGVFLTAHFYVKRSPPVPPGFRIFGFPRPHQKAQKVAAEMKVCPRCAESVKSQALVCRFCGFEFDQQQLLQSKITAMSANPMSFGDEVVESWVQRLDQRKQDYARAYWRFLHGEGAQPNPRQHGVSEYEAQAIRVKLAGAP